MGIEILLLNGFQHQSQKIQIFNTVFLLKHGIDNMGKKFERKKYIL